MSTLDEIKARAEKATPGPWAIDEHDRSILESINSIADDRIGGWVEVARSVGADAEFIAHARTDIPKLLAAVEAVETVRDTMRREEGDWANPEAHFARLIEEAITGALA